MCGPFSSLTMLIPDKTERMKAMYREAYEHLKFCASVYRWQHSRGKYFLHEHPFTATRWRLSFMVALRKLTGVDLIVGDQCPFGQGASYKDENGNYSWALVRKRTGWLTNHPRLKVVLNVKCPNCRLPQSLRHTHIPTLVGGRAKSTEIYPPRLVHAILKAHVEQLKIDKGIGLNSVEIAIGPHVDEDPLCIGYSTS